MEHLAVIAVCFVAGIVLRSTGLVPESGADVLNKVVIRVSLPAVAVLAAHRLPLSWEMLAPALMAWFVFGLAWLVFRPLSRMAGFDPATFGCLMLAAGLGNTSFVGLPMIEAFYGHEYVGVGVLCDLPGSFLVLAVPGMALASRLAPGEVDARAVLKKVLLFTPLQALVLGFTLQPVAFPAWVEGALATIGGTLTPLALLAVGMVLRLGDLHGRGKPLAVGLAFKLGLAPLAVWLVYMKLFGLSGTVIDVTVFEAAMPPMVTGALIASEHRLNPPLAALLLGVGIPLSFATLPVWAWLLG